MPPLLLLSHLMYGSGPVKIHKLAVVMTTTTTPTPKASYDATDHGHQTKEINAVVMTGVTWALTLPL